MLQIEFNDSHYRRDRKPMPSIGNLRARVGRNAKVLCNMKANIGSDAKGSVNEVRMDVIRRKKFAGFTRRDSFHDFGTRTSRDFIVIFFLTSFFINSIHQLVAVEDRCTFP